MLVLTGLGSAATTLFTSVQKALLEDMLPTSSERCLSGYKNFGSSSSFKFPGADPKAEWYSPYVDLEQEVFLAQMSHVDKNENRSWTLRIGQGRCALCLHDSF